MKLCINEIIIWETQTHIVMTLILSFQLKQKHDKWNGLKKCSKIQTHFHKCETLRQKKQSFNTTPFWKLQLYQWLEYFKHGLTSWPCLKLGIFIRLQVLHLTSIVVIRSKGWFFYSYHWRLLFKESNWLDQTWGGGLWMTLST